MKTKPNHISQEDWDSVDVPDMGSVPSDNMFRSSETTAQGIADDVMRQYRGMQKVPKKLPVSIRLSPDVVEYFRTSGKGWQTRLDNVLRDYVAHH